MLIVPTFEHSVAEETKNAKIDLFTVFIPGEDGAWVTTGRW